MLIQLEKINKIFYSKNYKNAFWILHDINLKIDKGEFIAITGPSGSGKTTLMNIIGLLDRPTNGSLKIDNQEILLSMPEKKLTEIRSQKIGFIFQSFNLLPKLTSLENVLLPTVYTKSDQKEKQKLAQFILSRLGLSERINHKPPVLSGGEKQRVAIARALINDPEIILADEPTGNLDSQTGQQIIDLLKKLNKEGRTVIIVTHNQAIANESDRVISLLDGKIVNDNKNIQFPKELLKETNSNPPYDVIEPLDSKKEMNI